MRSIAVFDTNVLFSGTAGWRGTPYQSMELARSGVVELIRCIEIVDELESRLQSKLNFSVDRAASIVTDVLSISRLVKIAGNLKAVAADPDDDKIIECAVVASATHIVTGDRRHLLPMRNYKQIEIVSPSQFVAIVKTR